MHLPNYIKFDLTFEEFAQCFLDGKVSFGSWWQHIPGWWAHKDESNILFVQYEDMKKDLVSNVRAIAKFLGRDLSESAIARIAEACTIETVKAKAVDWRETMPLNKGVIGDWRTVFTPDLNKAFDERYLEAVCGTGLEFDFD